MTYTRVCPAASATVSVVTVVLLAISVATPANSLAQINNGDFENGLAGWATRFFLNAGLLPANGPFTGVNEQPGGFDQTIVVTGPTGTKPDDLLGAAATLRYPKFGANSARVNGSATGYVSNEISQQFTITSDYVDPMDGLVHVRFVAAPVMNGAEHGPSGRPFYAVKLSEVNGSDLVTVYQQFVFAFEPGVPWQQLDLGGTIGVVNYTDWRIFDIPAPTLAVGDAARLEITGADCSASAHFGYIYVDAVGPKIPGLSVSKTALPSVQAGDTFTYTFTYRNDGPSPVDDVVVTETIPACATWVSNSNPSTGGSCSFDSPLGVVTCTIGTLAAGSWGTFTVTVTASVDPLACPAINNGSYAIQGDGQSPTLGPPLTTQVFGDCRPAPASMTAWWPLDEPAGGTAAEVIAGRNGTHEGTALPIARLSGHVGTSLDFQGDQRVRVPSPADGSLDFGPETGPGSSDFSIDAWILPHPDPKFRNIVWKGHTVSYGFGLRGDRLSLVLRTTLADFQEALSVSIPGIVDGHWHLVAVTVDRDGSSTGGALVRFYTDGALVDTQELGSMPGTLTNASSLTIGRSLLGGGSDYNARGVGGIDEVEIFRRVLSPLEIQAIWSAGSYGKCSLWCVLPKVKTMCPFDTTVTVPLEIHNLSVFQRTVTPVGSQLLAGFQFGSQTSTVDGPMPPFSFSPFGTVLMDAASTETVQLTMPRPAGFTNGKRAAYQVRLVTPSGDRNCVGFLLSRSIECPISGNDTHPVKPVGVPLTHPFTFTNDGATDESYDAAWFVEDSEGALDTRVVGLGSSPPGQPITRTVTVPANSSVTENVLVTAMAHEGMRAFDVVLNVDVNGDGELEPVASSGLRTAPGGADVMPGRTAIVVPAKLVKFVAKPVSGSTFVLPGAAADPTLNGGSLAVFDTGGPESDIYSLPASGWRGLGNPPGVAGYKYKGAGSVPDPCKVVLVKSNVVKAVCRGPGITLTMPFLGDAGFVLAVGPDMKHYCARFGGTTSRNDASLLRRSNASAPPACPLPGP